MSENLAKPDEMQDLVTRIARALVDIPEAVAVDVKGAAESTTLRLRVAPQEVGKVIGKQGRLARSVRTILSAVGMKHGHRYMLNILHERDLNRGAGRGNAA